MRELTEDERRKRDRRRAAFDEFLAARMPVLADFADRLGLQQPAMIVADPSAFLPAISTYLTQQAVSPEDRLWILERLGYYFGELLVQQFAGRWLIDEVPDSRYFLRYVVGGFRRLRNPAAMIDPFEVADAYLSTPPGRDMQALLDDVFRELERA